MGEDGEKGDLRDAARNSASLYYFALEAWAVDVAVPGEGCPGKVAEKESTTVEPVVSATPTATAAPEVTGVPEPVVTEAPAGGQNCHTHDDGVVHCE